MKKGTSVVHITTVHRPFDPRIFHRECVSLAAAGYRTTLIAHADHDEERDGVRIVSLGPRAEYRRLALGARARRAKAALQAALDERADLYHIHDPELIPTAIALKRRTTARVVYDCHEDNVGYALQKPYIPRPLRRPVSMAVAHYEKRAADRLDAVVTADSGVGERFEQLGARTVTVYNFPRLELFDVSEPIEKTIDLVYHGSVPAYHLAECFAIDDAVRRRGRTVQWLFFGSLSDIERARAEAAARGAADRFLFEGPVPHTRVAHKVATARLGIIPLPDLPKFRHNIPTKLFEFMALRMPVVLSDLPPSRRFVGDGACATMVRPSDAEAYADAILRLLDEPGRRDAMGEEGRRRVEQRYNWDLESRKLVALYESLLEERIA